VEKADFFSGLYTTEKALETEMNSTVWNQWDGLEETVDDQTDVLAGLFWP
jgi:hypothetical protein